MPAPNPPAQGPVIIGIGDYHVGEEVMSSIGLGSCVGLVIHDNEKKIGGMAHVMLPESQGRADRPGKFADSAVEVLVSTLISQGCRTQTLVAKMVGGSAMFKTISGNLNIGERNVIALKELLAARKIPLIAEDTGGSIGRTIVYCPGDGGRVSIKLANGTKSDI